MPWLKKNGAAKSPHFLTCFALKIPAAIPHFNVEEVLGEDCVGFFSQVMFQLSKPQPCGSWQHAAHNTTPELPVALKFLNSVGESKE